jgi:hypothetical protein
VRRLSDQEVIDTIEKWLHDCEELRKLDFNGRKRIREGIEGAAEGYLPISRQRLKEENQKLYRKIS